MVGTFKVLGAVVLALPRLPRLKEWADAGIVFNMLGAAASHALAGDVRPYGYHLLTTVSIGVLALVSWALLPDSRSLGSLWRASAWQPPTAEPAAALS